MLSAAFASRELWDIIGLSLAVSLAATAVAAVVGLPLGVALAIWRFGEWFRPLLPLMLALLLLGRSPRL